MVSFLKRSPWDAETGLSDIDVAEACFAWPSTRASLALRGPLPFVLWNSSVCIVLLAIGQRGHLASRTVLLRFLRKLPEEAGQDIAGPRSGPRGGRKQKEHTARPVNIKVVEHITKFEQYSQGDRVMNSNQTQDGTPRLS